MLTCFNSNSFQLSGAEKLVVCYCKETYWFSIQQPGQRNKTSYVQQLHTRGRDGTVSVFWQIFSAFCLKFDYPSTQTRKGR